MSPETHQPNSTGHGDYERRDIGASGILYFLASLALAGFVVYFIVNGLFWYLSKRTEAEQAPVSPLVRNIPSDTRRIPPKYNDDYQKFLQQEFPAPQLEVNERTELNDIRLREENTLSTYGWVDEKAGTIHIPIDRAMELLAQRGLPVRAQGGEAASMQSAAPQSPKKKGNRK